MRIATQKIRLCIVKSYKLTRLAYKYSLSEFDDIEVIGDFDEINGCIAFLKESTTKTDIILVNTIEAAKALKREFPEIKVIILTLNESKDKINKAMDIGVDGYVIKDIDFEQLHNVINSIYKGVVWFDTKVTDSAMGAFKNRLINHFEFNDSDYKLTSREKEVLRLLAGGLSNTEISQKLYISSHTAKAHVSNIISKLSVKDRVQAAVKACKMGILD